MRPTDTSNPEYFHKVVDCQYACPAHTDVPGYIRHIAQGEFTQAYMLNRSRIYSRAFLVVFAIVPVNRLVDAFA